MIHKGTITPDELLKKKTEELDKLKEQAKKELEFLKQI